MYTYEDAKNIKRQCQQVVFDAINKYKESGTEATLNFIIEKLKPYIYVISELTAYSYKKTLTTDAIELAEDVTSITMVKLWKHLGDFNNQYPESIFSWIGTTVENHFRDIYKKGKHKEVLLFSSDDFDKHDNHLLDKIYIKQQGSPDNVPNNPENMQISQDINKILMYVLGSLSEKEALIMRYKRIHGLDNASIAQEMNVSLSTVAHSVKSAEKNYLAALRQYEQKTGTKLYSLAIFELLGVLYYMSAQETTVPESVSAKFNQMLAEQVATETTKATGKEVVKSVVKKATDTVTKKIIIGVVTTTLVVGTIFSILQKPDNDTPSDSPIEAPANTPISFDEPLLTLDEDTQARLSVIIDYYWKNIPRISPLIIDGTTPYELPDEHYIQILTDLVVHKNILGYKTRSTIKMNQHELSDFMQHTLSYPRKSETLEWSKFFSQDKDGMYVIVADKSISYEQKWTFTSITPVRTDMFEITGYTYVDDERVKVEARVRKNTSSVLNGYQIYSVDFEGDYRNKDDIIDILKPQHIEDLTCMGQRFWSILSNTTGGSRSTIYTYLPIISKKLVVDNVLQKKILIDSQNQEYILASESELTDFMYNIILREPTSEEIGDCFEQNSNGEYIVKKSTFSEFEKTAPESIILTHAYLCTDSPYAYVFTKPGNTGGTLVLLAEHTPQSYVVGCNFYYSVYTPNNFMNEDELIDHINQLKAEHYEWYKNLDNEQ